MADAVTIWNKLRKYFTPEAAAGIMANLYYESALRPDNLQNSYNTKLGLTDQEYTERVDTGEMSRDQFSRDAAGYGLAQWTYWSRKAGLYDQAKLKKVSISDLDLQISYIYQELKTSYPNIFTYINAAGRTPREVARSIMINYERPADQSAANIERREKKADDFYKDLQNVSDDDRRLKDLINDLKQLILKYQ